MIDGRILTAVLASLAAVAAGISGGGISADQVKSNTMSAPGEFSFDEVFPESLSFLDRYLENPEPETEMTAVLTSEGFEDEQFRVRESNITASEFKSMQFLTGNQLQSEDEITLYGFTGEIMPGNTTELTGSSNGLVTGGVNISGALSVGQELETGWLKAEGVERSAINLEQVSGTIESEDSSTTIGSPREVDINSFSGDITVYASNATIVLDGEVHRLESGSFSFGG